MHPSKRNTMQGSVGVPEVDMLHACVLVAANPRQIASHPIEDAWICVGRMRHPTVDASFYHGVVHCVLDPWRSAALFSAMATLIEGCMELLIQWQVGIDNVAVQEDRILKSQQMGVDLKATFSPC